MNRALRNSRADVLLVVVPVARLRRGLVASYVEHMRETGAGAVYGDYELRDPARPAVRREQHVSEHDLSESSSFGYVRALRRDVVTAIGGWDESFTVAEDYDLRLRLGEATRFARGEATLYDVVLPGGEAARAAVCAAIARYFTPDGVALPGFAYLRLRSRVAEEVQHAFLSCLARRGALLDGPTEPFACPHAGVRPLVSVVIPTLDRAPMLERAIASVRGGTMQDFEILVVDNGSSDDTAARVERLARADPRVVLLRNPRRGIGSALNLGVRAARGKYVSQLDSDDEYVPETLARQTVELDAHPDWALAISYYDVIDARGAVLPEYGVIRHDEYDRNTILRTGGAGAVRTWHRCVIETLGGFDHGDLDSYAEDYDLVCEPRNASPSGACTTCSTACGSTTRTPTSASATASARGARQKRAGGRSSAAGRSSRAR
jgi:GT2 family glycosyltransferase